MSNTRNRIAYFISPHGYGHAARSCAVMEAVHRIDSQVEFDVYTKVPRWFFEDSLSGAWTYHSLLTDIGFIQKTPLEIDLPETISRLDKFYPPKRALVESLARKISRRGCGLIVCDIAPLGIQVAKSAGLPSVLLENFTWDWLYEAYVRQEPRLEPHIRYLRGLFALADFHVQTEPVCRRRDVDLVAAPISRSRRRSRSDVRRSLSISRREKVVLITMGGISGGAPDLKIFQAQEGVRFLMPGTARTPRHEGNLILLPRRSEYFHPDLVEASDAVIGKIGYSTLAETYRSGVPFGYLVRKDFRESPVLVAFAKAHMPGMPVTEKKFNSGRWVSLLAELLAIPRVHRRERDDSNRVALFLRRCLSRGI